MLKSVLLFALSIVGSAALAQSVDCGMTGALTNPSFEDGTTGWTYRGNYNGSFQSTTGYQKCGRRYGLLTTTDRNEKRVYQDIAIIPTQGVTLTVWAGIHDRANQEVRLIFLDAGNNEMPEGRKAVSITNNVNSGGLKLYELTSKAPAGAKKVRVEGYLKASYSRTYYLKLEMATVILDEPSLPVALSAFEVKPEGNTALLSWATTEEKNSGVFEVEHSKNGTDWKVIGEVAAAGNYSGLKRYSFSHAAPTPGNNLYRLHMIDRDGTSERSRIISFRFAGAAGTSYLYPNPGNGRMTLVARGRVEKVTVFDVLGKEVFNAGGRIQDSLDLSHLPKGGYIVRLTEEGGTVSTVRIQIRD